MLKPMLGLVFGWCEWIICVRVCELWAGPQVIGAEDLSVYLQIFQSPPCQSVVYADLVTCGWR